MSKSVYEIGKNRFAFGMIGVAAVLLSLVAVTGYFLMTGDSWYKLVFALVVILGLAFICLKTARGSQRRAVARATSIVPSPAPPPARPPVKREASFVHKGVRMPLGEAFDQLLG
jgi:hypothetical protein